MSVVSLQFLCFGLIISICLFASQHLRIPTKLLAKILLPVAFKCNPDCYHLCGDDDDRRPITDLVSERLLSASRLKSKSDNKGQVVKIYIKFEDEKAGLKLINYNYVTTKRNNWVPIERVEASIKVKVNKDSSPIIKRTQFPLKLWACTVHKVKGLSLPHAVVNFDQ